MENIETNTQSPKFRRWLSFRNRLRFAIFRRDNFTCRYCGHTVGDGIELELEHIIPKSKGGRYSEDNLLTSCHDCNDGKDDSLLTEFEIEMLRNTAQLQEGVML